MKDDRTTLQVDRKKKFFLVLPVFLVPFVIVFFFLFGGGRGNPASAAGKNGGGINTNLPAAHLKDSREANKMSFYEQADRDSATLKEKLNSDPYFGKTNSFKSGIGASSVQGIQSSILRQHPELGSAIGQVGGGTGSVAKGTVDSNERKVYETIRQLNESLASSQTTHALDGNGGVLGTRSPVGIHGDVDRLEGIVQAMKDSDSNGSNAQIQQWNRMLDKIIAIQHPENRDSLQRLSGKNKGKTYPVSSGRRRADSISLLEGNTPSVDAEFFDNGRQAATTGFYELEGGQKSGGIAPNVVTATVDETQTLVTGSDIRLRLTADLLVDGTLIPAGTAVSGVAVLSGERLKVQVSSIRYGNALFAVSLNVYDVDGVAGIYIPGSISRDVGKESADQAIGGLNMMSMDPSVSAQAATAGIEAAKTLISKKVRLIRVTVKDAYQVFLRDSNN